MFFSEDQIRESVANLQNVNPFFGIAFLALKRAEIPVGATKQITFSRVVDEVLQAYYRPVPSFTKFYTPFKSSNPRDRWNDERYASTTMQRITADTFGYIFLHPKGSQQWGWKEDYINLLLDNQLKVERIPVFDLAVWLFRDREWYEGITRSSVVELFFVEFKIRQEERKLFDLNYEEMLDFSDWLQPNRISVNALLNIIGEPSDRPLEESATLSSLKLVSVGPAREMEIELAPRLNIITGDNGLGKTFLLDCTWWALTGNWASGQAYPYTGASRGNPSISFEIESSRGVRKYQGRYIRDRDYWSSSKRGALPGLCVYARADGSFAIWDPAKRRILDGPDGFTDALDPQVNFSREEVLYGKTSSSRGRRVAISQGLIRDWLDWQYRTDFDKRNYDLFTQAIEIISPHSQERLIAGEKTQLPPDFQDMPTLQFSYGEVPFIHCSAGIQRVVALVYMLVWSWLDHVRTSSNLEKEPDRSIVLLVDEVEAHLHPFWQRTIVPAMLNVIQSLNRQVQVQAVIATHSPLILASVESIFDEEIDNLFHLNLNGRGNVEMNELPFIKRGRVDRWLTSEVFGLREPRSLEGESVIERAEALQQNKNVSTEEVQNISDELLNILGDTDPFWARWVYYAREKGIDI